MSNLFYHGSAYLYEGDLTHEEIFLKALSLHEAKSQYLMYNLASNDYRTRKVTTLPDPAVHQVNKNTVHVQMIIE